MAFPQRQHGGKSADDIANAPMPFKEYNRPTGDQTYGADANPVQKATSRNLRMAPSHAQIVKKTFAGHGYFVASGAKAYVSM
jgi:hypothetical protein